MQSVLLAGGLTNSIGQAKMSTEREREREGWFSDCEALPGLGNEVRSGTCHSIARTKERASKAKATCQEAISGQVPSSSSSANALPTPPEKVSMR